MSTTNRLLLAGKMRTVCVELASPPIPMRGYDWCAYLDEYEEGPCGWGLTEAAAVRSLEESLIDIQLDAG